MNPSREGVIPKEQRRSVHLCSGTEVKKVVDVENQSEVRAIRVMLDEVGSVCSGLQETFREEPLGKFFVPKFSRMSVAHHGLVPAMHASAHEPARHNPIHHSSVNFDTKGV